MPYVDADSIILVSILGLLINLVGLAFFHEFSHGGECNHGHGGQCSSHHKEILALGTEFKNEKSYEVLDISFDENDQRLEKSKEVYIMNED